MAHGYIPGFFWEVFRSCHVSCCRPSPPSPCWRARTEPPRRPRSSGGTPWAAIWARRSTQLADQFNKSQKEYKVNAVYKGSYTETLTAAIAAFRAKQAPHIVQVFEVGTANMMAAKGAVYPIYQVMADAKEPFDPKAFIGPVYGYYSTTDGKLLSMPFNSSTPVFYWNKEMFSEGGPRSQQAAQDLEGSGRCAAKNRRRRAPSAASPRSGRPGP